MYRLNDEQQRIADTVAGVADRDLAPRAADVDREAAFPGDSVAALGASGLLGLNVPKEHGGLGQGPRTAVAVIDALAQRCPSTAMISLMHLCGIACYGAAADNTAPLLQAAAAGRHLSTLAFSEKDRAVTSGRRSAGRPVPATAPCGSARRSRSSPRPDTPTATSFRRCRPAQRTRSRARSISS